MPDLSLKNIPTELYRRLKQSAKRNHRSLNKEAVFRIEIGLHAPPKRSAAEVRQILQDLHKLHRKLKKEGVWMTDEEIRAAIEEGRP